MPLSPPKAARRILHERRIVIHGYEREDGLFDIEALLADTKAEGFRSEERGYVPAGEPLHGMWMRLTVDRELNVVACEAVTDYSPYPAVCPQAAANFSRLAGLSIRKGFVKAALERVGGVEGCTHLRELLQQMATTAFQTLYSVRMREMARKSAGRRSPEEEMARETGGRPPLLDTCLAWSSASPVIARRWPHLYTGPRTEPGPEGAGKGSAPALADGD